jgi:hypothetical protein
MKKCPFLLLLIGSAAFAGTEGMPSMPIAKPTKSYTVQKNEDLQESSGFGDGAQAVRMQNLMMVEGSGMEGMDMSGDMAMNDESKTNHAHDATAKIPYTIEVTTKEMKVGANTIDLVIKNEGDQKPAKNLKLKAQVYMTSMDMGTQDVKVKEAAAGIYRLKATFSMKGPWAVRIIFPDGEKILDFNVGNPK